MQGTLSVVATPIGNLEDITLRALRTLRECDAVFCEDTRVTGKLLSHYEISKPLVRCDAAQEADAAKKAIDMLIQGKRIALVTDAGTPGISDPGARLVKAVRQYCDDLREEGREPFIIEAIPGASAITAALSIAGIEATDFVFLGFLPHKKGRQTLLKEIGASERVIVVYESPHRIKKLLEELEKFATASRVTVAKELTKIHERVIQGTAREVLTALVKGGADRGEFVVIIESAR